MQLIEENKVIKCQMKTGQTKFLKLRGNMSLFTYVNKIENADVFLDCEIEQYREKTEKDFINVKSAIIIKGKQK